MSATAPATPAIEAAWLRADHDAAAAINKPSGIPDRRTTPWTEVATDTRATVTAARTTPLEVASNASSAHDSTAPASAVTIPALTAVRSQPARSPDSNWTTKEPAAAAKPAKNSQLATVPDHPPDDDVVVAGSASPPTSPTAKECSPKLPCPSTSENACHDTT